MNYRIRKYILSFSAVLTGSMLLAPVHAEIDAVQKAMIDQYGQVLRWDNVENGPEWVAGKATYYSLSAGMHLVTLKPGDSVKVRIPKGERLRVFCPDCRLTTDDLMLDKSDGSGLYARMPVVVSATGRSLLTQKALLRPELVTVYRPKSHNSALKVGLYISRHEYLGELAPYRKLIRFDFNPDKISSYARAGSRSFWEFEPGMPREVKVQGPARFVFETRLAYPVGESRLLQSYDVSASINGYPLRQVKAETTPDTTYPIKVNGVNSVVGKVEKFYLEIPEGKYTLALHTSTYVYGRLLQQEQPDYLIPGLNQPKAPASSFWGKMTSYASKFWGRSDKEIRQDILSNNRTVNEKINTAMRVARDNSRLEGGMTATNLVQNTAHKFPHYQDLQREAEAIKGNHSFYRDVLPRYKMPNDDQYQAWFIPVSIQKIGEQGKGISVGEQFLQELLSRISSGFFAGLPENGRVYTYDIPKRKNDSLLRVIVDSKESTQGAAFYVQLGNDQPTLMYVMPYQELPISEYALSQGGAGLGILAKDKGERIYGTLTSIFSESRNAAPLIQAGTFELPLPAKANTVKIWKATSDEKVVKVAIQYRTSKTSTLSETEYRDIMRKYGAQSNRLQLLIRALKTTKSFGDSSSRELTNNWLPLTRFLRNEHKLFSYKVGKDVIRPRSGIGKMSVAKLKKTVNKARVAEREQRWLVALELWSEVKNNNSKSYMSEAQLGMMTALYNLGEKYLADLQLKGIILYSNNAQLRKAAYDKLLDFYLENDDADMATMLASTVFVDHPTEANADKLFSALIDNNQYAYALMVGLALPVKQQRLESMLRASYQLGWWITFNDLRNLLHSKSDRAYWLGMQLQKQGYYKRALKAFKESGDRGVYWYKRLVKGRQIYYQLLSNDQQRRLQGVKAWEVWQTTRRGPFVWNNNQGLVKDYLRAHNLYSVDLDLYSRYFEGSKQRPIKVDVAGPVKLRLEIRVLHPANNDQPIDGWVYIRDKGQSRAIAISNDTPSQSLKILNQSRFMPGRRTVVDLEVGPGMHEFNIDAGGLPFIAKVYTAKPELGLNILPDLNTYTVTAALSDKLSMGPSFNTPCMTTSCLTVLPSLDSRYTFSYHAENYPYLDFDEDDLTMAEQYTNMVKNSNNDSKASGLTLHSGSRQSFKIGSREKDKVINEMTRLVWIAETNKEKRKWATAHAESLAKKYISIPEIQPLYFRLTRNTQWLPLTHVDSSAGTRFVEQIGWQPLSPTLRVRKAIIGPFKDNERILYGENTLLYTIKNVTPSVVKVGLAMEDIPYLRPMPLKAVVMLDGKNAKVVTVHHNQKEQFIQLKVPDGDHSIRVKIIDPVANQYLKVTFDDSRDVRQDLKTETAYLVSTHKEPVVITVNGPTILRIDEWQDGNVSTVYHLVNKDIERVQIAPKGTQQEALIRIAQRIPVEKDTIVRPRTVLLSHFPVAEPFAGLGGTALSSRVTLRDGIQLGGQQNGTWSLSYSHNRRKDVLENTSADDSRTLEVFDQLAISHRYYSENWNTYFTTTLSQNIRHYGGATLGLREDIYHKPIWAPIILRLRGEYYYQNPNGNKWQPFEGSNEWQAVLSGSISQIRSLSPKTYHVPRFSALIRSMSLADIENYDPKTVDQDIFTSYKQSHPKYISVGDTLYHRPWLDSVLYAGASVTSTENLNLFNPDNVRVNVGFRQLFGDFEANPSYQYSRYVADKFIRRTYGLRLAWNRWTNSKNLLTASLNLQRDIDVNTNFGFFEFTWHTSNGRGYRDVAPPDFNFLDIKKRQIPNDPNNYIEEGLDVR